MKILLLQVLVVLAAGCTAGRNADLPREPVIVAGPEVKVGVRERCVLTLPDEPQWAVNALVLPTDADLATRALARSRAVLVELEQRRNWLENVVRPALKKCE